MKREDYKKNLILIFLCGAILGLISFIAIYGYNVLDVQYDDWLKKGGDLTQHYLGWRFYRNSNWSFPIGLIEGLTYPSKISIIYTDSIPLFAVIFKILSRILPEKFQYFGIWGAISFMLQGGISAIIIKKFTKSNIIPIVSSMFFIISPVILQRMFGHTALAGHWIILCALAVCVYKEYFNSFKKNIICWSVLLSLAVSIHMYFIPMVVAIMFFYYIKDYIDNKKIKEPIIVMLSSIILALLTMYILGAFYGNSEITQGGLGLYSANINSLFNSQGMSKFLLQLPVATDGQYEGYAYLGIGVIVLLIIALVDTIDKLVKVSLKDKIKENKEFILVIGIMLILFIFALSPTITFNDKILFNIPIPSFIYKVLSIFRASGRFMWPIMYILMILVIISVVKNHGEKVTITVLTVCCILQIIDLSTNIKNLNTMFSNKTEYSSQLKSQAWKELSKDHNKIIFIPINNEGVSDILSSYFDLSIIFDIGDYAIDNNMSMNDFYIGRRDSIRISQYRYNQWEKLKKGKADKDAIYVFPSIPFDLIDYENMNFYNVNDIIVGYMDSLEEIDKYEDVEQLNANSQYSIKLENNNFLINGEDTENGRILKRDGISYGPYISLTNGTYKVTIQGENLNKANYDVCTENGEDIIQCNELYKDTNKIEYTFNLEQDVDGLEIRIMNNKEEDITIKEINFGIMMLPPSRLDLCSG